MTHRLWRAPLLLLALLSMVWGVWLGPAAPRCGSFPLPWPDQLILHGPLMIGGFLGTLICLARAMGIAKPWAYLAPLCTASGALLLVFGPPGSAGPLLITTGSAVVITVFLAVVRRQSSLFACTMLTGTAAWFVGMSGGRWAPRSFVSCLVGRVRGADDRP